MYFIGYLHSKKQLYSSDDWVGQGFYFFMYETFSSH